MTEHEESSVACLSLSQHQVPSLSSIFTPWWKGDDGKGDRLMLLLLLMLLSKEKARFFLQVVVEEEEEEEQCPQVAPPPAQ